MAFPSGDGSSPLAGMVGAWPVSPSYMRTVTAAWGVVSRVLECSGYQPLMPDLLPELPHEADEEAAGVARVLRGWGRTGAALPLHYHLTRPRSPAPDGAPRAEVGAFSALRDVDESARQLGTDFQIVRDLTEALDLSHAGHQLLSAGGSRHVTGVYVSATDGSRVQLATLTDYGEEPGLLADFHVAGPESTPVRMTALHIHLTALADQLIRRNPGLEVRP